MSRTIERELRQAADKLAAELESPWVAVVLTGRGREPEFLNAEDVPPEVRSTVFGEASLALLRGAPRSAEPIIATIGGEGALLGREAPEFVVVPLVAEVGLHGAFFAPAPEGQPSRAAIRAAREAGTRLLEVALRASQRTLVRALELHKLGRPVGALVSADTDDRITFSHAGSREEHWPVLGYIQEGEAADDGSATHFWDEDRPRKDRLLRIVSDEMTPWETDSHHVLGLALRVVNLAEQLENNLIDVPEGARPTIAAARSLAKDAQDVVDIDRLQSSLDIGPLMEEARDWFEPVLRSEGVQVITLGGVDLPAVVANPFTLRHAFRILIDRVRRSRKGKTGILSCRAWTESDHVMIAVSDNGRGVPAHEVKPQYLKWGEEKVIDPNAENDPHRLSELQRLLQPIGGKLEVESRPRIWTRFTIRLPVHQVEAQPEKSADLPPAVQVVEGEPDGLEILVVDDNQQIRDVLRRFLVRLGHRVTVAEDGALATDLIGKQAFDRVLLDVNMPGQSGPAFFASLNDHAPELRERTIFMTGGVVEEEVNGFIRGTGRPRLGKPFMLDELVQVLQ